MNEFKGTKGKWSYEYDGDGMRFNEISCFIDDVYEKYKEDAQLISKAPEMLDFINRISGEMLRNDFVLEERWYEQARKLIQEATEIL